MNQAPPSTTEAPVDPRITALGDRFDALRASLSKVVVGQEQAMDEILVGLLAGGHVLLRGVPGVAKTLMARALAAALGMDFRRVQFTPDLMPADIIGTNVFDFQREVFHLQKGPVFTQLLLADEINRTPPKTQAALLEAMQERQVTIDGQRHELDEPFFVIATQNPLDHEGTYPLPEAQLDRFLLEVVVGYPAPDDEIEVYRRFMAGTLSIETREPELEAVVQPQEILALRALLAHVHVEDKLLGYLQALVAATRSSTHLAYGASPRAGMALLGAARAWAALEGRSFVIPDDIKRMAHPVLRHRLIITPDAELDGLDAEGVLNRVLDSVEVPR
jgi:MoxR-like ATPase